MTTRRKLGGLTYTKKETYVIKNWVTNIDGHTSFYSEDIESVYVGNYRVEIILKNGKSFSFKLNEEFGRDFI